MSELLTICAMGMFIYVAEISRGTNDLSYGFAFAGVFICTAYAWRLLLHEEKVEP